MDIFKFNNPHYKTKMESGEIINGLSTKTWIERYLKDGEFTLTAPVYTGMKEILPIGAFVSHVNTREIMVVENHEISDRRGEDSEITITGRSFETVTENRIVGGNKLFPVSHDVVDYPLWPQKLWQQVVFLIKEHIYASEIWDDNNAIPFVTVTTNISSSEEGAVELRQLSRGTLYEHVIELLEKEKLGIKSIRPGGLGSTTTDTTLLIHRGTNKSGSVIFSRGTGQIESADYLWSNKEKKNAAMVTGKWVEVFIHGPETGIDRRILFVSASDIDDAQETPPTGLALAWIVEAMKIRGKKALAAQKDIVLTQAEVAKDVVTPVYRVDYDLGDLVRVVGDYNTSSVMRVTEYAEIEDETGHTAYPTFEIDPPEEI